MAERTDPERPDDASDATNDGPFGDWPRPLAFVLSGGGAFGSVQVGMARALLERGVRPDLIVGSSIGSLHGALLAARLHDAVDVMETLWADMDRRSLFGGRRALVRSMIRHRRLSSAERLGSLIDQHIMADDIGDLSIPFAAVVTDAITGEPETIDQGDLRSALLASSAVPGVFPEVEIDGRPYVDGGVSANIPLRQAIALGAASIVALDATPPLIATRYPKGLVPSLIHSVSLMLRNQRANAVDELTHRYPIALLPSATPPGLGTFNFNRTANLIADSYALTSDTLDEWSSLAPPLSEGRESWPV